MSLIPYGYSFVAKDEKEGLETVHFFFEESTKDRTTAVSLGSW